MKYPLLLIAGLALGLAGCHSRPPGAKAAATPRAANALTPAAASALLPPPAQLDPASLPLEIKHGNPNIKAVALTIDDGPHPAFTPQILAILAQNHVHATFFVVGIKVAEDKKLIMAERAAGHVVENHTYNHLDLKQLAVKHPEAVRREIERNQELLAPLLGAAPQFLRPPAGHTSATVDAIIRSYGMTAVMYGTQSDYGQKDPQVIYHHVVDHVKNGTIILLHDGVPATLIAMPQIIQTLQQRGYQFQTIVELAQGLVGK
jgi:peptidoglycan/xylan/chitin deacetylase (PgdA/CDA1 family)